jgi:hopanoid-associated phosphorylase
LSLTGVVAALDFEARSLGPRRAQALVCVSGIGAENAARAARELAAAGAGGLLSWGVAGALDPSLHCGTAVLPLEVLRAQRRFPTDPAWRQRVTAALQGHVPQVGGALLTSEVAVAASALKARLFEHSGAAAVDMESAAIAEVAAQFGLPFLALRVILDTAHDSLPDSVLRSFAAGNAAGSAPARPRVWPLLRAPADWGRLLRLAAQYRTAGRALAACARRADPTRRTH